MSEGIKPTFSPTETLEQINEKARIRGMSYGQYVRAREFGFYAEDYFEDVPLKHDTRQRFCCVRNRVLY